MISIPVEEDFESNFIENSTQFACKNFHKNFYSFQDQKTKKMAQIFNKRTYIFEFRAQTLRIVSARIFFISAPLLMLNISKASKGGLMKR